MTNTPVTEVNSFFTTVTNRTTDSGSKNQADAQSFTKVLSETAGKSVNAADSQGSVKQSKTVVEKPGRKDLDNRGTEAAKEPEKVTDGKEFAEKVTAEAEKIKGAIKEELGVTEEEIVQAMETLGLSLQDLLNTDSLKELMLTLSGAEDSLSLLTNAELYDSMKEIMQMAADAAGEIKAEFMLTDDEFAQLLKGSLLTEELNTGEQMPLEDGLQPDADPEQTPVESAPEKTPPTVKVEVERSQEARITDPVKTDSVAEAKEEAKGIALPQTQESNAGKSGAEAQSNELFGQTTTTTNTVGDMVETVKQFAQSYVDGEEIMRQITEYVKVNIGADTTSLEMQLHPESLGTVNMQITSQNGIVTAQLLVQNEAVKAALETQLVQLQETFAQQGQKVESVEVTVANYNLDRGLDQNSGEPSERQEENTRGTARRRLNLNDLDVDALDELDEEEQLAAAVMNMHGNSVDFTA